MPSAAFEQFWRTDLTRECFLSFVDRTDLKQLRLVCSDFAADAAPPVFAEIKVNFTVNVLSRRVRMRALDRIGGLAKRLNFHMPHDNHTFLPPLLDAETGLEQHFTYEPVLNHSSRPSSSSSSSSSLRSDNPEISDLLIRQYPPLFHAATNIAAFHRLIAAMPNLRHVQVSCPDQPSGQQYRRSCVDYALISLRIALETANLRHLTSLALGPIHPAAIWYLRPAPFSIGCSPVSARLWRRIQRLDISMSAFPRSTFDKADHYKLLQSYLTCFPSLTSFHFKWIGGMGPSPVSLHIEPCTPPNMLEMLMNECPCPTGATSEPALNSRAVPSRLQKLKYLRVTNASLDVSATAKFISSHRKVLDEVDFDNCLIRDGGTWEEALAPLIKNKSKPTPDSNSHKRQHDTPRATNLAPTEPETMEVPIVLNQPIPTSKPEIVRDLLWKNVARESGSNWGTAGLKLLRKASMRTREVWRGRFGREQWNAC